MRDLIVWTESSYTAASLKCQVQELLVEIVLHPQAHAQDCYGTVVVPSLKLVRNDEDIIAAIARRASSKGLFRRLYCAWMSSSEVSSSLTLHWVTGDSPTISISLDSKLTYSEIG